VPLDKNEGVVKQDFTGAARFASPSHQSGGGPKLLITRIANHFSARLTFEPFRQPSIRPELRP